MYEHVPKHDNRRRRPYGKSVRLWVVRRKLDQRNITHFGVMWSIQRSVYRNKLDNTEHVQYEGFFYPLHSNKEFEFYQKLGVKGEIMFFSNEAGISGKTKEILTIAPAPFIFENESEGPAH